MKCHIIYSTAPGSKKLGFKNYQLTAIINAMRKLKINMISESATGVKGHGVHTAFEETVNALAKDKSIDLAVNSRRPADINHIQTVGPYSLSILLFGKGKKVVTVHVIPDSFVGSLVGAKYWYGLGAAYLKFFYNRADQLIAVSDEVKTSLEQQLRVKPNIKVIFNSIDSAEYKSSAQEKQKLRREMSFNQDDIVIVSSGQIQPRKRFDVFVELARSLPDYKFIWVGGIPFKHFGAQYGQMMRQIRSAPKNLQVTGVIEHDQVRSYFVAADIFILPSEQENHPLAVIEAAAAGLPIILRDLKLYDSSFGQLAIRGNDSRFASQIKKLAHDNKYRQDAIKNSSQIAHRFDSQSTTRKLIATYRALAGATT